MTPKNQSQGTGFTRLTDLTKPLIGIYEGREERTDKEGNTYSFFRIGGKCIFSTHALEKKFSTVSPGTTVKVKYLGTTTLKNGHKMHDCEVAELGD